MGERAERTLGWTQEYGAAWVCTDMPDAEHLTIMPPLDAVTNSELACFRAHGRNVEGYIRGSDAPVAAERMRQLLSPAAAR
jgi:hypothetical protein